MVAHDKGRVFKGRLLADGMWVVHVVLGSWVAAGLGLGLWGCFTAFEPGTSPSAQRMLVIIGLAIAFGIDIPLLIMWRDATRPIVMRPDGIRMGKTLIPYEDIVFLGISSPREGDLVLTAECDSATGRVRRDMSLPRWVASHNGFLEELRQRASRMILRREGLLRRAITLFANTVLLLWGTVAAALLSAFFVPPWRANLRWLGSGELAAILGGGTVACVIYVMVAGWIADRRDPSQTQVQHHELHDGMTALRKEKMSRRKDI